MIIECPKCGNLISDKATVCPTCNAPMKVQKRSIPTNPDPQDNVENVEPICEQQESEPSYVPPTPPTPPAPPTSSANATNQRSVKNTPVFNPKLLAILLAAVIFCLGGFFLFKFVIKPIIEDNNAPRYYTFAPSVIFRTSKTADVEFNKICSFPYGTELIMYDHDYEWSEVKAPHLKGKKDVPNIGYIASRYILEKSDFFLLNSIFGDSDSKAIIKTSKCRRALLNYFKDKNYVGRISDDQAAELGLPLPNVENQWQVFCLPDNADKNYVHFKKVYNENSKYTDFAVIIKNINTGERKLLLFYFEDDETPHFLVEQKAPANGAIKHISLFDLGSSSYLVVDYTE